MSTEQITREAIDLPLRERVSLAQRLWESIEQGVVNAEERQVVAEAVRRDNELTSGAAVGREHGEVMQAARQRFGSTKLQEFEKCGQHPFLERWAIRGS